MSTLGVAGSRISNDVRCPNCRGVFSVSPTWPTRCDLCGAKVAVLEFDPPAVLVDRAVVAMPEDVTCAFHPGKRAETTCAGTGSYICALCAVPVGDQTYSAEFINGGGLATLGKGDAFERTLPRPDYLAGTCVLLSLLLIWTFVGPLILLCAGAWYFAQHLKLRRTNPLYAKATSTSTTVALSLSFVVFGGVTILGVLAMVFAVVSQGF